jgi:hypothetical protein
MTVEEYKLLYKDDDAPGWNSIDKALLKIYPDNQVRHYPPLCGVHFMAGGTDPIDGASVYDSENQQFHRHIISYGMSELYYNEDAPGKDFSKWGFEFTFRLAPFEEDKTDPLWAVHLMNNLARYVFESGRWFEPFHFLPAKGPIRANTETEIHGLAFIEDPELGKIETPHGEVTFLQIVGITKNELDILLKNPSLSEVEKLLHEIKKYNPLLITDLNKK